MPYAFGPSVRATYLVRPRTFAVVIGGADDEEYLLVRGRLSKPQMVVVTWEDGNPTKVARKFVADGWRVATPPPAIDLADAHGKINLRHLYNEHDPREEAEWELLPGAERPAHRIRPEVRAAIDQIARRVGRPGERAKHRNRADWEALVTARSGAVVVMGWLERQTGLRSAWTGKLKFISDSQGEFTYDGDLLLNRGAVAAAAEALSGAVKTRPGVLRTQVGSQYHLLTLLHEGLHAVASIDGDTYGELPGLEEALCEELSTLLFPAFMRDLYGERVEYPRSSAYRDKCAVLREVWKAVARGRGAKAQTEFYLEILRQKRNEGRLAVIRREMADAGYGAADIKTTMASFAKEMSDY
jgi:hypothetical protein